MKKLIWLLLVAGSFAQTIGTQTIGPKTDTIAQGHAKAFQVTSNGGTLSSLSWYLDSGTTATKIQFGLYVGVAAPGGLSTPNAVTATGPFTTPGFACVPFAHVAMPATWKWWIAILPLDGTAVIRDGGAGLAVPSSSGTLTGLPANWAGATATNDGPATAFGATTACPTGPPPPTQAAAPTFAPASGTFTTSQTVSISDTTAGATVFFTKDGSTPTTASTVYTGPLTFTSTTTLKALATATGFTASPVTSGTYTLSGPPPPHSVTINWTAAVFCACTPPASPPQSVMYNVLRSLTSGGPYTQIGQTTQTTFTDNNVAAGVTYFYVTQTVTTSANSSEIKAVVPTP